MNFSTIMAIAVGLAMDAFSVAVALGAAGGMNGLRPLFRLSVSFGLFQFFMPVLGWVGGSAVAPLIGDYDHWVAFSLLCLVGGKMIYDSISGEDGQHTTDPTRGWTLMVLSVATSIDALAVGLGLAFLRVPILYPSAVIGATAFVMTAAGCFFGERMGKVFGRKMEVLGGLVLIAIGVRILVEHLG